MTLIWQLAWRYLRGKRAGNAVPVLSRISMLAIAVGSGAMIVLFSVFNGFEDLIKDLYKAFYPEIKITTARGKFYSLPPEKIASLKRVNGVETFTFVIEDNVLISSNDVQRIATLKGVDAAYNNVNNLEPYIYDGRSAVHGKPLPTAISGLYIANELGLDINNVFSRLMLYYPDAALQNAALNPTQAFRQLELKPDGIFRVQDEVDGKYILAPLEETQTLFGAAGKWSSIELKLRNGANADDVKNALQQRLRNGFLVATRYEQNRTLYMVMQTEKWVAYALLLLVLLIASFNMVGALSLLVLEKKKDIGMLRAMGATNASIHGLFLTEGILWAGIGGSAGLLVGGLICWGQMQFGWIKLQGQFIIDAYPVAVRFGDVLLIIITVLTVGLLAGLYPASRAVRAEDPSLKSS